ncbi:hypothetical protein AAP_00383 [Ascosphaera apis ARSEF 7405]|uniref:Uncharacterized protein n=1 Tax=Ascosphaera apis ARSEF 7405 TaxID=392613 RepID=A0A162ITC4_9EURO|nr:hypothetical protein AAP_00383 [Ascosphaera apis ARSEF 7405]
MSALNSTSHSPGAAPDITWAPFPGCEEKAIELPTMEDSLQDLAVKMRRLSEVVINNYSLAFSTAFKATQYSTSDPVKLAIPRMNPLELREYQAWTKEPTFPGWNKDTCKLDRANWDLSGEAKLQEWTEAVRLMFNDPTLEREHTVYLYTEVKVLVPIITAHIKLNTAIRQLTVKDADLTANEFADSVSKIGLRSFIVRDSKSKQKLQCNILATSFPRMYAAPLCSRQEPSSVILPREKSQTKGRICFLTNRPQMAIGMSSSSHSETINHTFAEKHDGNKQQLCLLYLLS